MARILANEARERWDLFNEINRTKKKLQLVDAIEPQAALPQTHPEPIHTGSIVSTASILQSNISCADVSIPPQALTASAQPHPWLQQPYAFSKSNSNYDWLSPSIWNSGTPSSTASVILSATSTLLEAQQFRRTHQVRSIIQECFEVSLTCVDRSAIPRAVIVKCQSIVGRFQFVTFC